MGAPATTAVGWAERNTERIKRMRIFNALMRTNSLMRDKSSQQRKQLTEAANEGAAILNAGAERVGRKKRKLVKKAMVRLKTEYNRWVERSNEIAVAMNSIITEAQEVEEMAFINHADFAMATFDARAEDWIVRLRDVLAIYETMVAEQKRANKDIEQAVRAEVEEDVPADRYAGFARASPAMQELIYAAEIRKLEKYLGHASI